MTIADLGIPFSLTGFDIDNVAAVPFKLSMTYNTGALTLTDLDVTNSDGYGIYIFNQNGSVTLNRINPTTTMGLGH